MSDPFIGEIRMFAGNFAPRGWAFCDGQLLSVAQNSALFSLFGTLYGGDGRTTFGLPDLRGRIPVHQGTGPGLTPRRLGTRVGEEAHTLSLNELPAHSHDLYASSAPADQHNPAGHVLAKTPVAFYDNGAVDVSLNPEAISDIGGSKAHSNLMPTLCVNFIAALVGIYPARH
jgi:microcystin-dependent protein